MLIKTVRIDGHEGKPRVLPQQGGGIEAEPERFGEFEGFAGLHDVVFAVQPEQV